MKNKVLLLTLFALVIMLTACSKGDNVLFKEDYESLNGVTNQNGKLHREVTIPKNNPIVITDAKTVVKMIEDGEAFYVYFGSRLCPWCRSVIEKALEVANMNGIKKIYYIDIWDDEGNEILRDKYTLDDDGNPVKSVNGTSEYYKLLEYFGDVLRDYTYTIDDKTLSYGEKRIYAPNFFYISKGKVVRMTTGKSDLQTDSRGTLTEEILKDEEKKFDDFFINVCDDDC